MSKKILIVEDETALLYALQSQLSADGFVTFAADDGQKALDILANERPDLIVLDLILPQIDGWSLIKKIKSDRAVADTPIVIISNLSDDESRTRCLNLGARDYLAKIDYRIDELVAKIKSLI